MNKIDNGIFPFYTFQLLAGSPGLLHFVSSGAENIGFTENAGSKQVLANRQALAGAVGFGLDTLTLAHQIHSTNVTIVRREDAGRGAFDNADRLPDTDALITSVAGICLLVMSADCVPVLLSDPVRRVIAAVHAGWRGTVAGIVGKTVALMMEQYACRPEHILAGIGPSIGKCCFEVGREVAEAFRQKYPACENIVSDGRLPDKWMVDLWEANRRELVTAGLLPDHVEVAELCTHCSADGFFSYRRNGTAAGRFGAGIMLTDV